MEPRCMSVFVLEPSEGDWLPAEICIDSEDAIECECGIITNTWMLTYVQGGPPQTRWCPDNVWIYQCLPCGIADTEGNIVSGDTAKQLGVAD